MKLTTCLLAICCPFLSMCQALTIKGKIINEDGQPIAGATITINRTRQSGVTDRNGTFAINYSPLALNDARANMYDTLFISAIGYEVKRLPIDQSHLNFEDPITLSRKATILSEVILSTGYEEIPKERATGSFTKLDNERINLQPGLNILDRMEGITNAVSFDNNTARPRITVRGLSTILNNKSPLIVLDNFPFEGDIDNINPADIESITILKDAAAASIWGTRAGNGVIVITSKKAKLGERLKLSFGSNTTFTEKPDLFAQKQMDIGAFIDLEEFLYGKGHYNSQINSPTKPPLSPVVEILIKRTNGQLTPEQARQQIDLLKTYDLRKDYDRYINQHAITQQYNVSASGSSANISYLFSAAFDRVIDEVESQYNRLNLRLQNSFKLSPRFTIQTSLMMVNTRDESGKPQYSTIRVGSKVAYPYARLADEQGNPLPLYQLRQTYIDTAGAGKLLDWKYYPLTDHRYRSRIADIEQWIGDIGINYQIMKGLSLSLNYQHQIQESKTEALDELESYPARDLINRYSQLNRTTGVVKYNVPVGAIVDYDFDFVKSYNAKGQLNYSRTIGNHSIAAIAGAEVRQRRDNNYGYRLYGYNPELGTFANVDLVNAYPSFINGSTTTIASGDSESESLNRFVSGFANVSYTFRNRYIFSGSLRKDASNFFGVNANQKGVPLWSAGAGWILSSEKFYKFSFFRLVKLRATYGFSGNVDNNRSAITTITHRNGAQYSNLPNATVSQIPNPNLRWERVKMVNLAVDFEHVAGRINGSIEYYYKIGLDLFGPAPLDYTTGTGNNYLVRNVANMKGSGLDIELNIKTVDRVFKWQKTINLNFNKDRVTDYFQQSTQGSVFLNSGTVINPLPGKPVYGILSFRWAGLDSTGFPQGYLDGILSTNYTQITGPKTQVGDLVFSGPSRPTVFGNFLNTFSWKGFNLGFNITYKLGYVFRRESIHYSMIFDSWANYSDFHMRWQKPGDERITTVPSFVYPANAARDNFYNRTDVTVLKGDHIRLQFINISYALKNIHCKLLPVEDLQVYLNAHNLGLLWKANKYDIDPDFPVIPGRKRFTIGFRATL